MAIREAQDVRVFSESVSKYFEVTTRERAVVRSAYLIEPGQAPRWDEFSGVIRLSGRWDGSVTFTSSRRLLSHLLLVLGEKDYSDAAHLDVVGEIANTLSGSARSHFGEDMEIAPPEAFGGKAGTAPPPGVARRRPLAIPFTWRGYEACLVVHMEPRAAGGRT